VSPDPLHITSLQNARVKNLVRLRRRRARDEQSLFLIEEPLVIRRALAAGVPFRTVYFCPEQAQAGEAAALLAELREAGSGAWEFVRLSGPVMTKVAYRARPAGLLVVAEQVKQELADLVLPPNPLLVVLAGLEKPGNLGAVLRSADGAGADAVLLSQTGTDLFNPNVLRSSRGTVFSVPTVEAEATAIVEFLNSRRIRCLATTPAADRDYTACDLSGPVAIVLGNEDAGLNETWLARAAEQIRLPLRGKADSLNVAITAAVVLYEAVRQRG